MTGIGLIIASALLVGVTALGVLLWALGNGQYDDLDGDAQRILIDDDQLAPAGRLDLNQCQRPGKAVS